MMPEYICGFADFVPYAFMFAGIGFLSAVVGIVVLANADPILDKLLAAGFFSKRKQAERAERASEPASKPAVSVMELGAPMRDPKYKPRPRKHERPFLNRKYKET